MYIYWILLGLGYCYEITGTLSMKWASVMREMADLF